MAKLTKLQDTWKRGAKQDIPRTQMPEGSAWSLVDYIPDLDAPLRKRGGWAYSSSSLSAVSASTASATYVFHVRYAPFVAAAKLCVFDEDGRLYTVNTSTNAVTDIGAAVTPLQTAFHGDKLIIPASGGATGVKYYDGSTLGALSASAPCAKYTTVYRDRTLLANTNAQPRYVYFSGAGDPTSWDTTNGWLQVGAPVTGLAALPGALMVFQDVRTSRIRGFTPPPDSDMQVDDPLFEIGCTDARSIAVTAGFVVFANPEGVYSSNGTNLPTDLTALVGLKRLWQTTMSGYDASTWTIAGGFYRTNYIVTVMNAGTFKDCFVFDLANFRCWRASNMTAACFNGATQISEELWFGLRDETKLAKASPMWAPAAAYKNDGDGTAVAPVLESALYGADPPGLKTWRHVYLEYEMTDAATDNPVLTVSHLKNPSDSYTALSTTLAETGRTRKRLGLRFPSDGLAFKIAQTNASANTFIHALEADVHGREQSRIAQ